MLFRSIQIASRNEGESCDARTTSRAPTQRANLASPEAWAPEQRGRALDLSVIASSIPTGTAASSVSLTKKTSGAAERRVSVEEEKKEEATENKTPGPSILATRSSKEPITGSSPRVASDHAHDGPSSAGENYPLPPPSMQERMRKERWIGDINLDPTSRVGEFTQRGERVIKRVS